MAVEDLSSYRSLYKSCTGMASSEMALLIENLNGLVEDGSCDVNTSSITSGNSAAGGLPGLATENCVDDDAALSQIFGDGDGISCASAAAAGTCGVILQNSREVCGCSCPSDGSGPVCHNDDARLAEIFGDSTVTCTSAATSGSCAVVEANAPGICSCSCGRVGSSEPGDGDDDSGHRRNLQGAPPPAPPPAPPLRFLPLANVYLAPACPLDSIDDQMQAISAACCTELTPCPTSPEGLPSECTFDCARKYAPFMRNCRETVAALVERQAGGTLAKLDRYSATCSNFSVASMATAIFETHCGVCGDGNVDDWLEEECDAGEEANADVPDAPCRTNCTLPKCGDGIVDGDEGCDEGAANSPDGSCGADCQLTCTDVAPNGVCLDDLEHWDSGGTTNPPGHTFTLYKLDPGSPGEFRYNSQQAYADRCQALGLFPLVTGSTSWGMPGQCSSYHCVQGPSDMSSDPTRWVHDQTGWYNFIIFSLGSGSGWYGSGTGLLAYGDSNLGDRSNLNSNDPAWNLALSPVCIREH
eukprot:SAG31_NODE_1884_length_6996_cov_4.386835_2_plen_527_part_00